ncbi:hypothetical protein [Plantibacter sp. YIM 135347]|uniref:hypothetical protein n=1 Tax=Plantibacter sp. YIM 135347 TaxID=3423919 RepID=UPI003D348382
MIVVVIGALYRFVLLRLRRRPSDGTDEEVCVSLVAALPTCLYAGMTRAGIDMGHSISISIDISARLDDPRCEL